MIKKRPCVLLCLVFIAALFSSCDYSIRMIGFEFGQFPRLVYIAEVDTALDFSEATLVNIHADGTRNEFSFPESNSWITVEHNVDFNTPGIYEVEIRRQSGFVITFFVQVIDEEIFNELKSGVR